ncbi:MAG: mannose-1-phosphate guanylyltransferase/mannose-6-phosphate isomerase, partial [Arenicella sp.]|nr:mannose-1-phosphate guanylyltransferase/mannose-6-phosphate isomerase [Arenicella sp.]
VTFGVVPTYAETGYGYLKAGAVKEGSSEVFSLEDFLEKPNAKDASNYVASGDYFWNSGMFLFKASRYIEELQKYAPEMVAACRAALELATDDLDFVRVDKSSFQACPSDSIDYAVMEKTDRAVMVPLDAGWNDVGSWASLWSASEKDENGNSIKGDVIAEDTTDCYIQGESKLIATVGLESVVVVQTDDTILVATKDKVQNVKKIVERLKQMDRPETTFHRKVFRPWGYYDSIDCGERFQVKRLMVKPGAKLSVQMHHHRAEHWVVVSGTAEVRNGDKVMILSENESTYIPIGATHSLANPGTLPLEIIEVQSGSYLGEDDIVRFEDVYGRVPT